MLIVLPLKGKTGEGIDIALKSFVSATDLPVNKLSLITTDWAAAMIGSKNGFLLHHKIDESFPKFILYRVLHLGVLFAKVLPFKHVGNDDKNCKHT